MADNNKDIRNEMQNTSSNYPLKGLNTDYSSYNAPEGTWTFALNAVLQDIKGNYTALSNEGSNINCSALNTLISDKSTQFGTKYVVIGTVEISNNRSIIFLAPKYVDNHQPSLIVRINKECDDVEVIVETECLNFSVDHPIHAISRVRRGCMDIIYFIDGYNPNRALDVSIIYDSATFDCNSIKLQKDLNYPTFKSIKVVNSGGRIDSGLYRFAIKYLDEDFNETDWLFVSNPVSVYYTKDSSYCKIVGNYNESVDPTNGYPPTNKSIKISLTNLDTRYKYYKIAVIKATDATGMINKVIISDTIMIYSANSEFIYTGDTSGYTEGTLEEVQKNVSITDVAKSITQFDNHLILGNVTESNIDYCSLQSYASKIAVNYVGKVISTMSPSYDGDSKNPTVYFDYDEYMAGEVYALGIVYTFRNGNISPVYHIPGRPMNKYWDPATNSWNDILISIEKDDTPISHSDDTTFIPGDGPGVSHQQYKVYDTSKTLVGSEDTDEEGYMWYYQLEGGPDEYNYEESKCGQVTNDYWGKDFCGNPLLGQKIRHHRMPSRAKVKMLITSNSYNHCLSIEGEWEVDTSDTYTITITYDKYNCLGSFIGNGTYTVTIDARVNLNGTLAKEIIECVNVECNSSVSIFQNIIVSVVATGGTGNMTTIPTTIENTALSEGSLYKKVIGLKFYNVELPQEANGYFFVRAIRDDNNKLVYQRGAIDFNTTVYANDYSDNIALPANNPNIVFPGVSNFNYISNESPSPTILRDIISFESPEILVNHELSGSYFRLEYRQRIQGEVSCWGTSYNHTWDNNKDSVFNYRSANYNSSSDLIYNNNATKQRLINSKVVLERLKMSDGFYSGKAVINASQSNPIGVLLLDNKILTPGEAVDEYIYFGSLMDYKNVYSNLSSLEYINISNGVYYPLGSLSPTTEFGGDCKLSYVEDVNNIILGVTQTTTKFSTRDNYGIYLYYNRDCNENFCNWLSDFTHSGFRYWSSTIADWDANVIWLTIINSFIHYESTINLGLRVKPQDNYQSWFEYFNPSGYTDYIEHFLLYYDGSQWRESLASGYPEYYEYNNDYTESDYAKKYYSIPKVFDCCLACANSHPHRVLWSEKSFEEEINDNYKVFSPNNYVDIKGDTGEITNVFVYDGKLYVHTERQLYFFPKPTQEKTTSELTTYIGTGEFLSFGPFELSSHTGSKDPFATIVSNAGLFFVNREDKTIFLINKNINTISLLGISNFFMDNLQFDESTMHNPFMSDGSGFIAGYDSELSRILLTKYNLTLKFPYELCNDTISNFSTSNPIGYYYLSLYHTYYYWDGSTLVELPFNSTNFICDIWTLSYSVAYNFWISYHSYTPNGYFNIGDKMYSFTSTGESIVAQHNNPTDYLQFYGIRKPFIIEQIAFKSPYAVFMVDNLIYDTIAYIWDNALKEFVEDRYTTFNRVVLYNSKQCTGEIILHPKEDNPQAGWMGQQIVNINGEAQVSRLERNWFINNFNDYVVDYYQPFFIKNGLNNNVNDYIDRIINPSAIDFAKSWSDLQPLRDKFVYVRLIYLPDEDSKKLVYNFMAINTTKSIR